MPVDDRSPPAVEPLPNFVVGVGARLPGEGVPILHLAHDGPNAVVQWPSRVDLHAVYRRLVLVHGLQAVAYVGEVVEARDERAQIFIHRLQGFDLPAVELLSEGVHIVEPDFHDMSSPARSVSTSATRLPNGAEPTVIATN